MRDDESGVGPAKADSVDFERRPVLYLPDGRALVRTAGFHMSIQTTGTAPAFATPRIKSKPKPKPKPRPKPKGY